MRDGVIYDFGMNNGDDVEYYLLKALKVVGVEANPKLCREVEQRFAGEIADGRLVVLNCALSTDAAASVDFYIHKKHDVLSQLGVPEADVIDEFERIEVAARHPVDIIRDHGGPRYVKVDLEGFDGQVLRALFDADIQPPEISAESHSVDVFACLVDAGYRSFSLVDGGSVHMTYGDATIDTPDGLRRFSFMADSAGPFGEDIRSEWQDADTFFQTLAIAGLGWKDIHASKLIEPAKAPRERVLVGRHAIALARRAARGIRAKFE